MEKLINELNKALERNNQKIDEYLKRDYHKMLNILNKYMENYDNEKELSNLLIYPSILEIYPNIKEDCANLKALRKFNDLMEGDFKKFDIESFTFLVENYPNISFGLKIEQAKSLKDFLNANVTISKQPIIDTINEYKSKTLRLYEQLSLHIKTSLERLKCFLEEKKKENSVVEKINNLQRENIKYQDMLSYFQSNDIVCPSFVMFEMVVDFINESTLSEEDKFGLLKTFYTSTQEILINQVNRIQTVAKNIVNANALETLAEIRISEATYENQTQDKKIAFDMLVDQSIVKQLDEDELKIYNTVKERLKQILDRGGYSQSLLRDINFNILADMFSEEDPLRQSYTASLNIAWEEIIVDLFKHKNDKNEFLRIINGINEAIIFNDEITRLGLREAKRSHTIMDTEKNLISMNNSLLKLKQSQGRDELISNISLLLSKIGLLNENQVLDYVDFLREYETLCTKYNQFVNPASEKLFNNQFDNLIVYAPDFINQCREFPSPSFYNEIRKAIEVLENKEKLASIKGNSEKYRIADRNSNGISIYKTTHLIIYHTIINDNVIYVMGVSRKELDKKYGPMLNVYLNNVDKDRKNILTQMEQNREQFIKEVNQNQIEVLAELSKWAEEKQIGGKN